MPLLEGFADFTNQNTEDKIKFMYSAFMCKIKRIKPREVHLQGMSAVYPGVFLELSLSVYSLLPWKQETQHQYFSSPYIISSSAIVDTNGMRGSKGC